MHNQRTLFGQLRDGRDVGSYMLSNNNGIEMTVLQYGCVIQSLKIPVGGKPIDVVLGFDNLENYVESHKLQAPPHFGAVIGRYSGRIRDGRFTIDGRQFQLNSNNGKHTLHGGTVGFDKVLWHVISKTENSMTLQYLSPDGDENFPGNLDVRVTYTLTADNEIIIEYHATTDADTIINMTQHSYFNMEGHTGNVLRQQLRIHSTTMLETDDDIVPTGNLLDVANLEFDFSAPHTCPANIDHSFAIADKSVPAATLTSAKTGLRLRVFSDQPSVHLYIGGNLFGKMLGKDDFPYHPQSGICFESQNYPDAPNHDNFPSAILRKGEIYRQKTIWKFDNVN